MPDACSFIIPVLNEAEGIASLLEDLRRRYPAAELIVVDGGSADGTPALAQPLCEQLLQTEPGRALQMNAGAAVARGDYLLFLHADCRPGEGAGPLAAIFAECPAWGFCRATMEPAGPLLKLVAGGMNWRSRITSVATGDQMLFVHRDTFAAVGGFPVIPLMEDVAMSKRLRALAPPRIITTPVAASSRRWRERGTLRTIGLMWWLRLAYALGASPAALHRRYYGGH